MEVDARRPIALDLARRLLATQFPQWASLPIRAVPNDGWDNRSFRLGDDLKLRFPSAERYVAQVKKEARWLPQLARTLPLPIPSPIGVGKPGLGYPWPWSVQTWLRGETAAAGHVDDLSQFAVDLAAFLRALQATPGTDGPSAGQHNFHRGGALSVYDSETRACLDRWQPSADEPHAAELQAVWRDALSQEWTGRPIWVHGDVAPGNLLVSAGRLCAVIDFGSCGVGDPACDLTIAWTFFNGASREAFRRAINADDDMWARARGWTLWKALLQVTGSDDATVVAAARRLIVDVVDDHQTQRRHALGR